MVGTVILCRNSIASAVKIVGSYSSHIAAIEIIYI